MKILARRNKILIFIFTFFVFIWVLVINSIPLILVTSNSQFPKIAKSDYEALKIVNDHNMQYPARTAMGGFILSDSINTFANYELAEARTRSDQALHDVVMVYDKPEDGRLGIMHYYLVDKKNNSKREFIINIPDYKDSGPLDQEGEFDHVEFQTNTIVFLYDTVALIITANKIKNGYNGGNDTLVYYDYACKKGKVINLPTSFYTFGYTPSVVGQNIIMNDLKNILILDLLTEKVSKYQLSYFSQLSGTAYQQGRLYYNLYRDGSSPLNYGYSMGLELEKSSNPVCSELEVLSSI